MADRPYTDPGPIERGAYSQSLGGRPRFVVSVDGDTVRWGIDPAGPTKETSVGDFASWVYASRAVRWPGPYMQEVYDPPPIA